MLLPKPVDEYFRSKNARETAAVLFCFAPGAVVWDKGEDALFTGHDEIKEWLEKVVASYNLSVEPLEAKEDKGVVSVLAKVSGDFPGSPLEFHYRFTVEDDKIRRLDIL